MPEARCAVAARERGRSSVRPELGDGLLVRDGGAVQAWDRPKTDAMHTPHRKR